MIRLIIKNSNNNDKEEAKERMIGKYEDQKERKYLQNK